MISPIGVVIVTYNRKEKLKKALKAYDQQIFLPCEIIVVNNASTDGTNEILDRWKSENSIYSKVVIDSKYNVGGSGGFYLGEKRALHDNISWIMIADDDAYPDTDYIKKYMRILTHIRIKNQFQLYRGKLLKMAILLIFIEAFGEVNGIETFIGLLVELIIMIYFIQILHHMLVLLSMENF